MSELKFWLELKTSLGSSNDIFDNNNFLLSSFILFLFIQEIVFCSITFKIINKLNILIYF